MQAKRVTVTKAVLVNLGNYQNERVEVTAEAELDAGESYMSAYAVLQNEVNLILVSDLRSLVLNQIDEARVTGEQARYVRSHVSNQNGFDLLEVIAPGKAEELLSEMVELYAAPPAPPPAEVIPDEVATEDSEPGEGIDWDAEAPEQAPLEGAAIVPDGDHQWDNE